MHESWVNTAERLVVDLLAKEKQLVELQDDSTGSVVERVAARIQLDRVQRALCRLEEIWPHLPDIQRRKAVRINRLRPRPLCRGRHVGPR